MAMLVHATGVMGGIDTVGISDPDLRARDSALSPSLSAALIRSQGGRPSRPSRDSLNSFSQ